MAEIVQHKGKSIVFLDWANTQDTEDAIARIDAAQELITAQPLKSARTLTYVEGARFNRDVVNRIKLLLTANKPHVLCSAVVGLSGLVKVTFGSVTMLTGRNIKICSTVNEAKDWLVEQE